ncbi:hypothetical protein B0H16DRAFT_1797865 [Mycena metata]|uniref:3'-5' exonuclease domain-containing protein n=1 Tax=Mycena metata TaxID=1033252 RepID=A0AAD7HEC9_9AGAR|nr:hypothetical protein B0H16DRAFT_1797865 [Mycena metata]
MSAPAKTAAKTALQYLESTRQDFTIDWEHAGLCLVQIAHERKVWVLNMTRMRAFPTELQHILTSENIIKAGAGLPSDATVLWEDLRVDIKNMADVGLMTRLWHVDSHQDDGFSFMALQRRGRYLGSKWTKLTRKELTGKLTRTKRR